MNCQRRSEITPRRSVSGCTIRRGDAGGGTPSEGVWGNAPSWRGRGCTLYQTLNLLGTNLPVEIGSSLRQVLLLPNGMPQLCRVPHARLCRAPGLSARLVHHLPHYRGQYPPVRRQQVNSAPDKIDLVAELVTRETKHRWSSTAHAPADGAEG